MTEAEWDTCTDPTLMLERVDGRTSEDRLWRTTPSKTSDRKLRLFAASCCRQLWHLLTDPRSRHAVEIAEHCVDGLLDEKDRIATSAKAFDATIAHTVARERQASEAILPWLRTVSRPGVIRSLGDLARGPERRPPPPLTPEEIAAHVAFALVAWDSYDGYSAATQALSLMCHPAIPNNQEQAVLLLCHVFGNPFHEPTSGLWPLTVVQLAEAMYDGQHCTFALHDALAESGHPELADHFCQEQGHPKGCWALDLILHKK
jgi:hypothetical protein